MALETQVNLQERRPGATAQILFILIATLCLGFGFVENTFGVANQTWFEQHQKDTEGHVMGNMVRSSTHGLWEHSGLNGITQMSQPRWALERPWNGGLAKHHEEMYLEGRSHEYYNPYFSQPGAQAWIFVALDGLLEWEQKEKLSLFRWVTGISSALSLAFILSWLLRVAGWGAATVSGISMLFSPWLTVFGANLWWFLSAFFLPMVFSSLATLRPNLRPLGWFTLSSLGLFIKCMLTGYEYISTALVMSQIPLILDLIRKNDPMQRALSKLIASSSGALMGVFLTLIILGVQISIYRQDPMAGINHLVHSYGKRSSGAKESLGHHYNRGLEADVGKVVDGYRRGICYDLESKPLKERSNESQDSFMRPFRFNDLISTLKGLTLIWLLWAWISSKRRWLLISFLVATWASILAPLSWYVFFKAHSTVHWHMNYICWHMPFSFMVAGMTGLTIQCWIAFLWKVISYLIRKLKRNSNSNRELKEPEVPPQPS